MAWREYDFFTYIAASRSRQLYIGVTNGLRRRMAQHREHRSGTYTARYRIDRLVYYEHYQYVTVAIAREKELKDWARGKKIALIEKVNPTWEDLSLQWEPWPGEERTTAKAEADPYGMTNKDKPGRTAASAKAEADPYGMTNKQGQIKARTNRNKARTTNRTRMRRGFRRDGGGCG